MGNEATIRNGYPDPATLVVIPGQLTSAAYPNKVVAASDEIYDFEKGMPQSQINIAVDASIQAIVEEIGGGGGGSITTRLDTIDSSIAIQEEKISALDSSVSGIESSIHAIDGSIAGIDTHLTQIDSSVSGITSSIDVIDSSISEIENSIRGIDGSIAGIENQIYTIESSIDSLATSKIDKPSSAVSGNVAVFDANKNVIDSEKTPLELGDASTNAYRGDRGKTAYEHSQLTSGNPHHVTASDVGLGSVGNYKAVSVDASQGLTTTEQSNARTNIGAADSSQGEKADTIYGNYLRCGDTIDDVVHENTIFNGKRLVFNSNGTVTWTEA